MQPNKRKLPIGFTVSGVVAIAGGSSTVAKECGVSPQAVHKWKYIPRKHARKVGVMAGLPLEIIRPDMVQSGSESEEE